MRNAAGRDRGVPVRNYREFEVVVLLLYCLFWLPGLIASFVFWRVAWRDWCRGGQWPTGKRQVSVRGERGHLLLRYADPVRR